MKFRILESLLMATDGPFINADQGIYYIYKNPTGQELDAKNESKFNRAVIDSKGNLYMESRDLGEGHIYSCMIHDDLLDILHNAKIFPKSFIRAWHKKPELMKYGVCLQRGTNSRNFYLAESYEEDILESTQEIIKFLFARAKEKNPFINFCADFGYGANYEI